VTSYDVGIAGLGAMGSMAALELTRRGRRVIGFDRYHPPHRFGSSAGRSRIIREAYFEHPQYVPLVRRAYEQWAALEAATGERLLVPTGGLMIGPPDGGLVAGARRSALEHGLEYEELTGAGIRSRFPGVFLSRPDEAGVFEPRAGVLRPEAAISAALRLAAGAGAVLRYDEPVLEWKANGAITLRTDREVVSVERLVLACGAWMPGLLPAGGPPLSVARQTVFWFEPTGPRDAAGPDRVPVYIWEWAPGEMFYGFPDLGDGAKVAIHHQGVSVDPDNVNRHVDALEADRLRGIMADRTPLFNGRLLDSAVCLYTNTPDGDFVIDRLPEEPRVIVASPCSGHGFKFAPTIGEVVADLVDGVEPGFDLRPFRWQRG
jgi:sarcosine oxidase